MRAVSPVPSSLGHGEATPLLTRWLFVFFLVSGACSLVYQVVWLRLAMALFGVAPALVAVILSAFMAGLALGSWGAGALARRVPSAPATFPLRLYALAELLIALSGQVVPPALAQGRDVLAGAGPGMAWSSLGHLAASGLWVAAVLIPFCACMGATIPLGMWAIRSGLAAPESRSFSYLYVANVLGACLGTLASGFVLIEAFGFRGTALVASGFNALIAAGALAVSLALGPRPARSELTALEGSPAQFVGGAAIPWMLFLTGFASMGMEVVWIRQFTAHLSTEVYTFCLIVAIYLAATLAGSVLYRHRRSGRLAMTSLGATYWVLLGLASLLPLLAVDHRVPLPSGLPQGSLRVVLGLVPFCAVLGFMTPMLVDRWAAGDADRAGRAYAVNVVGCILGPLAAGFVLIPRLGERWTLGALAAPLFAQAVQIGGVRGLGRSGIGLAVAAALLLGTTDYRDRYPGGQVKSDYAATVMAAGQGRQKILLVNGIGMTLLTPITKMMAHLPAAHFERPPRNALVVCFGMGTTFRSLLSWGIPTTAVELVPSVPALFPYFHADAEALLRSPHARVVIDDGRRFLERSSEDFDVITIDPPPPLEAAGSGLLYSREFYAVAGKRLRRNGILQQWVPSGDATVIASFSRALAESFPHVRAFQSVEGWGLHFLASREPIPMLSPSVLARRLPPAASVDLLEWGPMATAEEQFRVVVEREVPVGLLVSPGVPALRDDRPVNEYYLLRRMAGKERN